MSSSLVPLFNFDIENYFKTEPRFGGVYGKEYLLDHVNKFKKQKKVFIVNIDEDENAGTHWVLCSLLDPTTAIYYDSYAFPPPSHIEEFLLKSRKHVIRNNVQHQDIKSVTCGYFCIYVAKELIKGRKFIDILLDKRLHLFTDKKKNDKLFPTILK